MTRLSAKSFTKKKKGHQFCNKTQTRTFLTKTTPAMFLTGAVDAKYKPRKKLQVLKWKGVEVPSAQATIWISAIQDERELWLMKKSAYVSTYKREKNAQTMCQKIVTTHLFQGARCSIVRLYISLCKISRFTWNWKDKWEFLETGEGRGEMPC